MKTLLFCAGVVLVAADITDFAQRSEKFSKSLYKEASQPGRSLLLSPFLLQSMLALTQTGAKGPTAEEISTAAFLPATAQETEAEIKTVLSAIEDDSLKISGKLFVDTAFSNNKEFEAVANDTFRWSLDETKFAISTTAALDVGGWANGQLNNQFLSAFALPEDFSKLTKDVLVNVLSSTKGWSSPMDWTLTRNDVFHTDSWDEGVTAAMMTQGPAMYNYHESEELDAKFVELALGEDTTFTIVLPNTLQGLDAIDDNIDVALTSPEYTQKFMQFSFPRLYNKVARLDLADVARKMGVRTAWGADADLSGIAAAPGDLALGGWTHDAYLRLDEDGIEIETGGMLNVNFGSSDKHFNVDHPFLFYIKVKGVVVLVGKVFDPNN